MELFVFFSAIETKIAKKYRGVFSTKGGKAAPSLSGLNWFIMRYDIAESGVFNKQGRTPFDSVGYENLHNVLRYADTRAKQVEERNRQAKKK